MATWIEPFDFKYILVNAFAGSMELFMFLSLIVIAGLGAYFRMLNATLLIMFAVFGVIMAQYFTGIMFFVILIGGLATAVAIGRIVKN